MRNRWIKTYKINTKVSGSSADETSSSEGSVIAANDHSIGSK